MNSASVPDSRAAAGRFSDLARSALRWLAWFHRWTGVALCLLFVTWFASGLVLVFVPFPSLSDAERRAAAEPAQLAQLTVAPGEALVRAGGGDRLRLVSHLGRPTYLVMKEGSWRGIDGTLGRPVDRITPQAAAAIASRVAGARASDVSGPLAYDQWIVHQKFDSWRPFFRVAIDSPQGEELYVSARTGEVVQRTRARERAWNWIGAVPHWLYFTVLRHSFTAWDQTVWWVALLGLTTAVAGTWLGVYRMLKRMSSRRPDWSPFRGWLRWHHGLGLGAAAAVLTWMVSGWLSMDHGRLFSRGSPGEAALARYTGAPLGQAMAVATPADLRVLGAPREIQFGVVAGRPLAAAEYAGEPPKLLFLDRPPATLARVPPDVLAQGVSAGWPAARPHPFSAPDDDRLYRVHDALPDRAVRFHVDAPDGEAALYVDPVTGQPLALIDPSRRAYAWTYFALHTFKFPGLIERPVLRRVLEIVPLMVGLAFSVTGLVIAAKRVVRDIPRKPPRSPVKP
jgi:PepSY-associated transmembrane protein